MENNVEKRTGAYISYSCNDELDFKLGILAQYQEKNNIEKVDWYYTGEEGNLVTYYKVITDIFEERIDTLLVVGNLDDLTQDGKVLEKIKQNVKLIKV